MDMSAYSPTFSRVSNFLEITEEHESNKIKQAKGTLKCSCGNNTFSAHYCGKNSMNFLPTIFASKLAKFALTATCLTCNNQILIYDSFIDDRKSHKKINPDFAIKYYDFNCKHCGKNNLNLEVIYQLWRNLSVSDETSWKDGDLEIRVSGKCISCNKTYDALLEK